MEIFIKDYIGEIEYGVMSMITIMYNEQVFEGGYWYREDYSVITFPEELELLLESSVENLSNYKDLLKDLENKRASIDEVLPKMKPLI